MPSRQAGDRRRFQGSRPTFSQCSRGAVALRQPGSPVRVPDGHLQSRRGRRRVMRDPVRHPRSPRGTCPRPTASCFANCLQMSRRRSSSSVRRTPPSLKRGWPALSRRLRQPSVAAAGRPKHRRRHERNDDRGPWHLPRTAHTRCGVGHHPPGLKRRTCVSQAGRVVSRLADCHDAACAAVHGGAQAVAAVAHQE